MNTPAFTERISRRAFYAGIAIAAVLIIGGLIALYLFHGGIQEATWTTGGPDRLPFPAWPGGG